MCMENVVIWRWKSPTRDIISAVETGAPYSFFFFLSVMSCIIHHGMEIFNWPAVGLGWQINFMSASKQPIYRNHLGPPQPAWKRHLTLNRQAKVSESGCWATRSAPMALCSTSSGNTSGDRTQPYQNFRLASELIFSTKGKFKNKALLWMHTALSLPIYYMLSLARLHTARRVLLLHNGDCCDRGAPLTSTNPLSFH